MENSLQQSHIHFPCLPLGMHLGEAGDPALLYYFNSIPEWHVMTSCHPKIVQACTFQNANFDLICAWKAAQTAVRSSWGWSRAHVRDDSHWPEAAHWTMAKCRHNGFVWFCALLRGTLLVTSCYIWLLWQLRGCDGHPACIVAIPDRCFIGRQVSRITKLSGSTSWNSSRIRSLMRPVVASDMVIWYRSYTSRISFTATDVTNAFKLAIR